MLKVLTEHIGNMAIVECNGRIANSEAASRLGEAITSEIDAEAVVLDLTEVDVVTNRALKMFVFLQHWARVHDIEMKVFGPSGPVRLMLQEAKVEVAGIHEMIPLLARAEEQEEKFKTAWAA